MLGGTGSPQKHPVLNVSCLLLSGCLAPASVCSPQALFPSWGWDGHFPQPHPTQVGGPASLCEPRWTHTRGQSAWSGGLWRGAAAERRRDAGPLAPSLPLRLHTAATGVDCCWLHPAVKCPPALLGPWHPVRQVSAGRVVGQQGARAWPKPRHHCHVDPCEGGWPRAWVRGGRAGNLH